MDSLADELLRCGTSVLYDANFTKRGFREKLGRIAKKHRAGYVVLWIQTPLSIAVKQAGKRSYHPIPKEVVLSIHDETEHPKNEPIVIIEGTRPYQDQKKILLNYLNKQGVFKIR